MPTQMLQSPAEYRENADKLFAAVSRVLSRHPEARGMALTELAAKYRREMQSMPPTTPAQKRWALVMANRRVRKV